MLQLPEGNVQLHVVMSEMALLPAQALATPEETQIWASTWFQRNFQAAPASRSRYSTTQMYRDSEYIA